MAIITTSSVRVRTETKAFTGTPDSVSLQYNEWEETKAADASKSYSCRVVCFQMDGATAYMVGEASYPERNEDPTGQVPESNL